ncbi:MAG: hypothetical protein ABMB14_35320 [Myxococcota bacterium]
MGPEACSRTRPAAAAHWDFYSYVPAGSPYTEGAEGIDGELLFEKFDGSLHLKSGQESRGHGVYAWTLLNELFTDPTELLAYHPAATGSVPTGPAGTPDYALVSLVDPAWDALWPLDLAAATVDYVDDPTFHEFGNFEGDCSGGVGDGWYTTCSEHSPKLPWRWDDTGEPVTGIGADGLPAGMMALDPAELFLNYFDGTGAFSTAYVSNPYAEGLRAAQWIDGARPVGFPDDLDLDDLYARLDAVCD